MANRKKKWDWAALADWTAIILGIGSIISNFVANCSFSAYICYISACSCLAYILYAITLYCKKATFDWHLINGHFLRKVCCLVILMPSFLSAVGDLWVVDSSKELVFANELFECSDNHLPCSIRQRQENPNIFWGTYYHFIDPGNQHMTTTKMGRIWAAIIAMLGVFLLNGLLVSSIIGWLDKRKEDWQTGTIRYKVRQLGKYQYAVVIGANEIASAVIKNVFTPKKDGEINYKCEGNNKYVILHTSRNPVEVRAELSSHISPDWMRRVIIYSGLRDSANEIENLYLEYATEIYVLGESTLLDGGETYHDTINMRCVNLIADTLDNSKEKRTKERAGSNKSIRKVCKVMFEYQTTSSIFQFSDISDKIKDNLVFIPFNRYESWARKVIVDGVHNGIEYTPLDGEGIKADSNEFVHLVIVGMSKMGVAMGVETLLQAHYLNSSNARSRITFIDTNVDKEMSFFKGRYSNMFELIRTRYIDASVPEVNVKYNVPWNDPMSKKDSSWSHLSSNGVNFLDVEIEFIKGEVESNGVRKCLREILSDTSAKLTIAICLTHAHQAIAASLYMPIEVYKSIRLQQIWVYQKESEDILMNLINKKNDLRYEKIRPFGMLYGEYMSDRSLYLKALLVNTAYDIANGYNNEGWPEDISNKKDRGYVAARSSWNKLSVDKIWSNKYYADSIYVKIRNVLYNKPLYKSLYTINKWNLFALGKSKIIESISTAISAYKEQLAICEHNRWNIQQLILGYSPCDEELDSIFESINANEDKAVVLERYLEWKLKNLHVDVCNKSKIKDDVKECPLRIHPNICSFEHLAKVDSGAQKYDEDLNNAIPTIISIVDGYKSKE